MEQSQLIGQSKQFNEKINTIKSQFFSALDDFKKYYVYFNKNPEVNEFQNYYANSKGQLQTMSKELFLTTNNIHQNIEKLDEQMSSISVKLEEEEKLYKKLMKLLQNFDNTHNGSKILIDDSKENYNIQYYKNVELFIGIIIIVGLLSTLFKKNIPIPITK
jgi:midasin (ATPase involved in ribosome maturation)